MTVSAGGRWEMLMGKKGSTKLQQILPTFQCSGFIWRHLCFVPGKWRFLGEKKTGLALRAAAWLRGYMGLQTLRWDWWYWLLGSGRVSEKVGRKYCNNSVFWKWQTSRKCAMIFGWVVRGALAWAAVWKIDFGKARCYLKASNTNDWSSFHWYA